MDAHLPCWHPDSGSNDGTLPGDPEAGTRGARVDPRTDAAWSRADRPRRLSIPLFQVSGVLEGQAATAAFAVATAVIGAGAAMLPTGAAAAASARILRSLADQDDGANQRGALNGRPDETSILSGVEASNGQGNSRHGSQ
jgi:hypothetical protein